MKTNYIPHSLIVSIGMDWSGYKILIITKEGEYNTNVGFTTDNNGIHGEFYKEEVDNDFSSLNELSKHINR